MKRALLASGLVAVFILLCNPLHANTITVNDNSDAVANDGVCTLREAITAANDNAASGAMAGECAAGEDAPTVDEIVFDATAFPLAGSTFILLTSDLPTITQSLMITGPGMNALVVDGNSNGEFGLVIDSATDDQVVTIAGLTVANMQGSTPIGIAVAGGDTLHMVSSRITGTDGSQAAGLGNQGGTVTITSSIIDNNTSATSGGGIVNTDDSGNPGTMTITGSLITGNTVTDTDNDGGGIINNNESTLTIIDSFISSNSTDDDGGGIYNDNATLTVTNSQITGNTASGNSSDASGGGIANDNGGTATIEEHSVIVNNSADAGGGGIINLAASTMTITDSTVSDNTTPGFGGGIANGNDAQMEISQSTIAYNAAALGGGGIFSTGSGSSIATVSIDGSTLVGNHTDVAGGGLINKGPLAETTITNSSIVKNTAAGAAGILNTGTSACIDIQNSTISDNISQTIAGGIADASSDNTCSSGFAVSLLNVTITANISDSNIDGTGGGGGILVDTGGGDFNITNTIIAGNFDPFVGPDCETAGSGSNGIHSGGHNLIGTDQNCADNDFDVAIGDQVGSFGAEIPPLLAVLTPLNGGDPANGILTGIHYPLTGSPAIDNGDTDAAPATDQHGVARPIGTAADIGAVEVGCGDGVVETGEECDDGGESATCSQDCTLKTGLEDHAGTCGNGIVDPGEECDDGGESATCNSNCTVSACGDGVLNRTAGEVCEDGNTIDGDTCSSNCKKEQSVSCSLIRSADPSGPGLAGIGLMFLLSLLALSAVRIPK